MTQTARTVLPTDLVALVSYDGRVYANEAMTRDRIGTTSSPHPLETAFEQWFSFATGRHTWISVKGATLRGLASARKRGSKLAWEIDCLINADDADEGTLLSLLDQVTEAAGRSGALRIFLRLARGAEAEPGIIRSGFAQYMREQAYRRPVESGERHATPEGLRRGTKADLYGTFLLYNEVVPEQVRRMEASTFAEFTAALESIGRARQYILERDGRIEGWLRVAGDGDVGRFDIMARHEALDALLEAAMAKTANREMMYILVPEHQPALRSRLESLGFEPGEEYAVFSRRTVRPVKAPRRVLPALVTPAMR